MSLNNPVMHEGYVPAYQVSAVPFVTSSAVTTFSQVSFPFVTRFFTVQNTSSIPLRFGFTELAGEALEKREKTMSESRLRQLIRQML
jgi:hypothetical protein